MGVPECADFTGNVRDRFRLEWETGDRFVYLHDTQREAPIAVGLSDFLALFADAAEIRRRFDAHQGAQIVRLTERGPMFLVERADH